MNMVKYFEQIMFQHKGYKRLSTAPLQRYMHKEGWVDTAVGGELIYSHRNTQYTRKTFTEKFHIHNYYELVIHIKGNVEYIYDNILITPPSPFTVIWAKPKQLHTARLVSSSQYERYVLCFSDDFFQIEGKKTPITDFITRSEGSYLTLPENKFEELMRILEKADRLTETDKPYGELILKALVLEIFYILDSRNIKSHKGTALIESMAEIKRYIDLEYATINSISDIADHFFYSREHLTRKFKQSFNTSIAQYLSERRILESLPLLQHMSVTDVAYAVGFHSQAPFIAAFKKNMGGPPAEYKSKLMHQRTDLYHNGESRFL